MTEYTAKAFLGLKSTLTGHTLSDPAHPAESTEGGEHAQIGGRGRSGEQIGYAIEVRCKEVFKAGLEDFLGPAAVGEVAVDERLSRGVLGPGEAADFLAHGAAVVEHLGVAAAGELCAVGGAQAIDLEALGVDVHGGDGRLDEPRHRENRGAGICLECASGAGECFGAAAATDLVAGLEDRDLAPRGAETQRSGQPGEARADDDDAVGGAGEAFAHRGARHRNQRAGEIEVVAWH